MMKTDKSNPLYPRNTAPALDPELFREPTAEYRGTPFWAWNAALDPAVLARQIDAFRAMGFGGAHMHSRTGLATPYLSDAFMACVRTCVEKAKCDGLLMWLYDEDRWPSGAAGGFVTRDPTFRMRHLLFTLRAYGEVATEGGGDFHAAVRRAENGVLLARYAVRLHAGRLAGYRRLAEGETACADDGPVWHAYLETMRPSPWFNNQTYLDTLNPAAVQRFVEVTHEAYARAVGDHFGATVPAIFTDEPQVARAGAFRCAEATADVMLPFTDNFPETFRAAYGADLVDHLPEVFWEPAGAIPSRIRYWFYDHVAERFAAAFADVCGAWCQQHGIAFTGHLMDEPTLESQTAALGEAMRSYRSFQLPGIDILCNHHEYTTAKQAQSAARQYGRPGVLSELYGATYWDFDFVGHKAQGDWQAALGVTVRVPHLAWVSMAGEAKRDYPAAIDCHSPWYREYPLIEDHFARLNTALTRGRPCVRVAVVHPVESFWLCRGPLDQTQGAREAIEAQFQSVTAWLLDGLIDFDYLCESLLTSQCVCAGNGAAVEEPRSHERRHAEAPALAIGAMRYEAVVVPGLRTIRATTLERLERFADAGGRVVFAGEIPSLVDAAPSGRATRLAARCHAIPFSRVPLLEALAPYRDLDLRAESGVRPEGFLYQMRDDGHRRWLLVCLTDPRDGCRATIRVRGDWDAAWFDTLTGRTQRIASRREGDETAIAWDFPAHGHVLLGLDPGWRAGGIEVHEPARAEVTRLDGPVPVTLSEPNVLLLDQAAWRWNDESWQPVEELLRIDNAVRATLGVPRRRGRIAQPWTDTAPTPVLGHLALRFRIVCDVDVFAPRLAMEDVDGVEIRLDDRPVAVAPEGWFVDEAIRTVPLPAFSHGTHDLVVTRPFHRRTAVEWHYLLGDFGVVVAGRHARLTASVSTLEFGDWTPQGLPFYAGNVTYHARLEADGQTLELEAREFKAPLLSVAVDGRLAGRIAFAPFRVGLGRLAAGSHAVDIMAYGNRVNAFGALHDRQRGRNWFGPDMWRTEGADWAYEYALKPMGVLAAPRVLAE